MTVQITEQDFYDMRNQRDEARRENIKLTIAAAELAKALTALVEECKTNLDFAVNPYNTEADALSAAGTALAEWEAVK